jgi:hypothetical protein
MDGFFEDPGADAVLIVTPAASALAVGFAGEFDEDVLGISDGAGVDDLFDTPPLAGESQFVADGKMNAMIARSRRRWPCNRRA